MSAERVEPGRYEGLPGVTGYYTPPDGMAADLESLVGHRELQESLEAADGPDLLRVFECLVRGGAGETSQPLIAVRRELQLRVSMLYTHDLHRLLAAARLHDPHDRLHGAQMVISYGVPKCEVCGADQYEWPGCDTGEACPEGCGGTLHASDGDVGCSNYYDPAGMCVYHRSADDGLSQYEGADSPAGVRYHDPEVHRDDEF